MAGRLGLESTFVDGHRVTDEATLEVATMVLATAPTVILLEIPTPRREAFVDIGQSVADVDTAQTKGRRKGRGGRLPRPKR